jgi:hypothetical protein
MRRGVTLRRLLGEATRFRSSSHGTGQSLAIGFPPRDFAQPHADLGIWQENRQAVLRRVMGQARDPFLASVYGRWHKEIFADLAAVLLGGTASAWGMMEFLAHPAPAVVTYRPGGAHPTGYLRVPILAEMLRRMGFATPPAPSGFGGRSATAATAGAAVADRGAQILMVDDRLPARRGLVTRTRRRHPLFRRGRGGSAAPQCPSAEECRRRRPSAAERQPPCARPRRRSAGTVAPGHPAPRQGRCH